MCNSEGHIEAEENSEAQAKTHPALTEQKLESSLLESKKLDDNELWEYVYVYTVHITHPQLAKNPRKNAIHFFPRYIFHFCFMKKLTLLKFH